MLKVERHVKSKFWISNRCKIWRHGLENGWTTFTSWWINIFLCELRFCVMLMLYCLVWDIHGCSHKKPQSLYLIFNESITPNPSYDLTPKNLCRLTIHLLLHYNSIPSPQHALRYFIPRHWIIGLLQLNNSPPKFAHQRACTHRVREDIQKLLRHFTLDIFSLQY